jgi:hypothetical protein
MGAWGVGSFDNDDALDWVISLEKSEDLSVVIKALDAVTDVTDDYLDASDCCAALAAAEVVAALAGDPSPSLPKEVTTWLSAHHSVEAAVQNKAKHAVRAILTDSELRELWEEVDEFDQWYATSNDLLQRLG